MIQIKNLTKIYKSKNKEKCYAINDISLNLDDDSFNELKELFPNLNFVLSK